MFGSGLFDVAPGFIVECEDTFRNSFHYNETPTLPLTTEDQFPEDVGHGLGLDDAAVSVTYGGSDDDDDDGDEIDERLLGLFSSADPSMDNESEDLGVLSSEEEKIVIECDIDVNDKEGEKRYTILSKDPSILLDGNYAHDDLYTWKTLKDLAIPRPMRYMCLYVRHLLIACERWLAELFTKISTSSIPTDGILPYNFERDFVPLMEEILEQVQQKRWACSISKKYNDALADFCLLPRWRYDIIQNEGFIHTRLMDRKMGNAFRKISKEINVEGQSSSSSSSSFGGSAETFSPSGKGSNPLRMVTSLWSLELKLTCLINLLTEWPHQQRMNIYHFPQLFDSRTLYSDSTQHIESGKSILTYDVNQIRVATSMLYWRWNDLSPSEDLWEYLNLLKARCSIISSCVLSSVVSRNLNSTHTPGKGYNDVYNSGNGLGYNHGAKVSPKLSIIDPSMVYSKYLGTNTRDAIASLCGSRVMKNSLSQRIFDTVIDGGNYGDRHGKKRSFEEGRKRIQTWITRKQRINAKIRKRIEMEKHTFDSITEKEDHRGGGKRPNGPLSKDQQKKNKAVLEYGDDDPRMVRQTLNKGMVMASESSCSSDDDGCDGGNRRKDYDDSENSEDVEGMDPSDHHVNQQKDDRSSGAKNARPEDMDYFSKYLQQDKRVYKNIGKSYSEADVCNEMLANYLLSSSEFFDGKIRDAFLPCLTTTCSIIQEPGTSVKGVGSICSIRSITYANKLFLTETHCLLSRIEQDVKSWDCLKQMERYYYERIERGEHRKSSSTKRWRNISIAEQKIADDYKNRKLSHYLSLERAKDGMATNTKRELLEVEVATIQCLLQWCYDYSNGQRNQFIYRNLRDPMYSMYLMPSEADMLLNICSIRNCNLNPSVIVSKIRHTDVDRLEKILRDTTTYGIMKEFARYNGIHIAESVPKQFGHNTYSSSTAQGIGGDIKTSCNESLLRLAKYIYEINTTNPSQLETGDAEEVYPFCGDGCGSSDREIGPSIPQRFTYGFTSLRQLIDLQTAQDYNESARRFASTHHMGFTDKGGARTRHNKSQSHAHVSDFNGLGITMGDIFQEQTRADTRKFLYTTYPEFRFLNDAFSVKWQCPRGIAKVVRITIIKVLDYFMKSISHHLDVNAFFFPDYVTLRLCNSSGFLKAMKKVHARLDGHYESEGESENSSEMLSEDPGSSRINQLPTRKELNDLLGRSDRTISIAEEDDTEIEGDLYHLPTSYSPDFPSPQLSIGFDYDLNTTVVMGSFAAYMHRSFERSCKVFFTQCPVILLNMCSSFLWNPRDFTAFECEGADSLIGLSTWLKAVMNHIQEEMISHVLVHNAFSKLRKELTDQKIQDSYYVSSDDEEVRETEERESEFAFVDEEGEQENEYAELPHFRNVMDTLYANHHVYRESKYVDGGMYYEDFLKLLGKSSSFGDHGKYSTMAQNLCVCVIKLCRMIYPHILEDYHFHLERPTEKEEHRTRVTTIEPPRHQYETTEHVPGSSGIQIFCPKMDEF